MSMKTVRILILAATASAVGVTGLTATAFAQTPLAPQQTAPQVPGQAVPLTPAQTAPRISVSQLATKLEQAGYAIREIEQKRYGWEAKVIDNNHNRLELDLDFQGNVIGQDYDD